MQPGFHLEADEVGGIVDSPGSVLCRGRPARPHHYEQCHALGDDLRDPLFEVDPRWKIDVHEHVFLTEATDHRVVEAACVSGGLFALVTDEHLLLPGANLLRT